MFDLKGHALQKDAIGTEGPDPAVCAAATAATNPGTMHTHGNSKSKFGPSKASGQMLKMFSDWKFWKVL